MSVGFCCFYSYFRHGTPFYNTFSVVSCEAFGPDVRKNLIFVPIIPHSITPPWQAFQPILIQIISRPESGAYLKSLWQRCHSLYRFGVQSRRSRFLRKYHYHLQIIAPGRCRFPFSPLFDRYIQTQKMFMILLVFVVIFQYG